MESQHTTKKVMQATLRFDLDEDELGDILECMRKVPVDVRKKAFKDFMEDLSKVQAEMEDG